MTLASIAVDWFWPAVAGVTGFMLAVCLRSLAMHVEEQTARVEMERTLTELRRHGEEE
jgi:hypothetical protein